VALKSKEGLLPSKGTADLGSRLTGHFSAMRSSFDFKQRKFLVICSPMQKEMMRKTKLRAKETLSYISTILYWSESSMEMENIVRRR
jgi:hypothetical protein